MKNKKIIGMLALVVILGVTGFIFKDKIFFGKVKEAQIETNSPKTLKDLLGMGIAQKCTYDGGTIYITGSKLRGDFESISQEKVIKSHMIVDNNVSYIWTEGETSGIKMAFDDSDFKDEGTTDNTTENVGFDPSAPLNYSCSAWIVDGSYFELPKGVNFTDMSAIFTPETSGTTENGNVSNSQCSYCNMLSGEDKESCLSSLNCE